MSFKDLTFSWNIGIGYYGTKHKDTVKVSDYFTEVEWNEMSDKEKEDWLDEHLETMVSKYLDADIWINE